MPSRLAVSASGRTRPPGEDGGGGGPGVAGDGGVTSIELAILFPAVLLVILAMFQISLYWHTANAAGVAAEQGVDAGQVNGGDTDAAESAALFILDSSTSLQNRSAVATITGNLITVTVTADAPRIVGIGTWRVRSVSEGRLEEFVPADQR